MKTLQNFALLILLFTAKTYCQDDLALEVDVGSKATEIKGPEILPVIPDEVDIVSETNSSILPSQDTQTEDIEVNSPASPLNDEENPVTIPETSESSSIATESEPSSESPEETLQIVDEGTTLTESVPDEQEVPESTSETKPSDTIIPPNKEEEIPASIPELPELPESSLIADKLEPSTENSAVTPQILDEGTTLSASIPEEQEVPESTSQQHPSEAIIPPHKEGETSATIPESPESSLIADETEPSTESPTEVPQIVDEGTTLNESVPEEQEVAEGTSEQQEESTSEAAVLENEKIQLTQSTDGPIVPEIVEAAEDEQSGIIATEEETSASNSEIDTVTVNEETTEPSITETVAEETKTEPTATENIPKEEDALNVNNESTTVIDELATSTVTISDPELNLEITSKLPNPSTEINDQVSSEPESPIANEALDISSTTISPCTEAGDIANPTNCRKYVSCSENAKNLVSNEMTCPERSAFNSLLGACTRDLAPCGDEEPVCLRAGSIPNPNGENSSYFWCIPSLLGGFHKYHIQCSQNEVFTPLLGRCWLESPHLGLDLGLGLINPEPSDRDIVRAEWKLLKKEIKLKAKAEKLRKKMEEKAKARAEKLAAKELKKQKAALRKVDDDDNDDEEDDD